MLLDHLESLMVLDPSNVSNVKGGVTPSDFVSVKLHQGGVVQEPPSPTMGRQPEGPPPSNPYHNLDPLLRLIGPANEATIIVEGQQFLVLAKFFCLFLWLCINVLHDVGECCESVPLDRTGSYISISINITKILACVVQVDAFIISL